MLASRCRCHPADNFPARGAGLVKILLRISTPAVSDDWHAKIWAVFKDTLKKSAPGEFDAQINLNASLFK